MEGSIAIELEAEPDGLLAARLIEQVTGSGTALIMVARSETRAIRLHQAISGLAPGLDALLLPAWDCLPYDRASPSRPVMGTRMDVLRRLTAPPSPVVLIASFAAISQRLPPPSAWTSIELRTGDPLDPAALETRLERLGYALDERADEPGEAAIREAVLDIFPPAGTLAFRVEHA